MSQLGCLGLGCSSSLGTEDGESCELASKKDGGIVSAESQNRPENDQKMTFRRSHATGERVLVGAAFSDPGSFTVLAPRGSLPSAGAQGSTLLFSSTVLVPHYPVQLTCSFQVYDA